MTDLVELVCCMLRLLCFCLSHKLHRQVEVKSQNSVILTEELNIWWHATKMSNRFTRGWDTVRWLINNADQHLPFSVGSPAPLLHHVAIDHKCLSPNSPTPPASIILQKPMTSDQYAQWLSFLGTEKWSGMCKKFASPGNVMSECAHKQEEGGG